MRRLSYLIFLSGSALAIQLPFKLPFFSSYNHEAPLIASEPTVPRIAIVGAGAGGSSAAFWISKAKERFGIDIEVDVYERESYIGGRSTVVYPHNDTTLEPIELGASIFVKANKNMWRASEEFNLSRSDFDQDTDTGIWDGENFVLLMHDGSFWKQWWSTVKVLWRYGYSAPVNTRGFVRKIIDQFVQLYSPESPKWDSISGLATAFHWEDFVAQTTSEYLDAQGISRKFTRELVEAATRVNYGQNVDNIHALEGLCSMAATGASSIQGGNYQVFEHFLNKSGAKLYLDTRVHSIAKKKDHWTLSTDTSSADYRAIILAAPYHSTNIAISDVISSQIPEQPYVHLHVTLLTTTTEYPNSAYFSLSGPTSPNTILTTYEGVRQGGKEPEFNSISYHGLVKNQPEGAAPEWNVKIFSQQRISDEWLARVFSNQVTWVHRKEWDAYPQLPPTNEYPPLKLDSGFYYVNAFEPFISTMETETIASRNVVDLLLHEEFSSGICGPRETAFDGPQGAVVNEHDESFVLGWDC